MRRLVITFKSLNSEDSAKSAKKIIDYFEKNIGSEISMYYLQPEYPAENKALRSPIID
jgi:hypothetical protein